MPSHGEDLAVRSLCNHSIIGVRLNFTFLGKIPCWEEIIQAGSYSQWGALLAGDGDVIYPTGFGKIVTGVIIYIKL